MQEEEQNVSSWELWYTLFLLHIFLSHDFGRRSETLQKESLLQSIKSIWISFLKEMFLFCKKRDTRCILRRKSHWIFRSKRDILTVEACASPASDSFYKSSFSRRETSTVTFSKRPFILVKPFHYYIICKIHELNQKPHCHDSVSIQTILTRPQYTEKIHWKSMQIQSLVFCQLIFCAIACTFFF